MGSRKKNEKRQKNRRGPTKPRAAFEPPPSESSAIVPHTASKMLPKGAVVIPTPRNQAKMSEVLLDFVSPFTELVQSDEEMRKLLTVGLIGWNAGLMPVGDRNRFIADMLKTAPSNVRQVMRGMIEELLQRKLTHFAANRRMIIEFTYSMTRDGPNLSVMSSLESI